MSDQEQKWDRQWRELLTHCHGGNVEADEGFKTNLLAKLKRRAAENAQTDATATPEADADRHWSKFLTATYTPCHPRAEFRAELLGSLKTKQAEITQPASTDDEALKTILTASYIPVVPRREFETRLLENLKERQRNTTILRRRTRRRTLFLSGVSSLAAAAMVMFVISLFPSGQPVETTPRKLSLDIASIERPAAARTSGDAAFVAHAIAEDDAPVPALMDGGSSQVAFASYTVEDVFSQPRLPATVRGLGADLDKGDGWKVMDESLIAWLTPGLAFRCGGVSASGVSGLGFGDGSSLKLFPDAVVETTERGFAVRQGTISVTVPDDSTSRFYLHFADREVAVEPGTMVVVSAPFPDRFAQGGAPAPEIFIFDGGMALAKGKYGTGPLLAGQVYKLDKYVSPDLPGRTLCEAERQKLEKLSPSGGVFSRVGGIDSGFVPATTRYSPPRRPNGFTKREAGWVADTYRDQQTVKIRYLSDEYFGFATSRRDLASSLALGSNVIIDGGDGAFYQIHGD